jgi:1-deoxy-D-xylulose-5-phosphate reductoisomerase
VLNAANEVAVARFLDNDLRFKAIAELIDAALQAHRPCPAPSLEEVESADAWARAFAASWN